MRTFCIFLIVMCSAIPFSGKAAPPTDKAPCSGTEDGSNPPTIVVDSVFPESPLVGEGVSFLLIAEDPDGQSIIIRSEFVEAPAFSEAKLKPPVGSTPAFYPDVEGTYIIRSTVTDERDCSSFVEVEVTAGLGETDCQPGEYVNGDQCSACPAGTFSDTTNATSCVTWTDCVQGEYVEPPGTATSDRGCSACPLGYTSYTINAASCELVGSCSSDSECAAGSYCDQGSCVQKSANGNACSAANECQSDYCVDGYCCNSSCSDSCDSCDLSGSLGTCTVSSAGSTGSPSCDPYVCDGFSSSCPSGCSSDADCSSGNYCDVGTGICSVSSNCGDGSLDPGEECDDGNTITESCEYGLTSCTVCDSSCLYAPGETSYCGDSVTDSAAGEECDDGNTTSGDGCSSVCLLEEVCVHSETRQCFESNAYGTCSGIQTCGIYDGVYGWGPCDATVPAEDICDGIDNNCDGSVDEPFTNGTVTYISPSFPGDDGKSLGDSCGTGACAGGSVVCEYDGASLLCDTQYLASTEICDDVIDNDCDGLVDEGCATGCASDADCAAGYFCDAANSCVAKKNNGDSCSDTNQCTSGFCVDGYCCNSSCGGSCDSCNVSGSEGSCTVNLAGSQGIPSCGAYLCNGSASSCPTSCAVDGDCSAGHFCDDGNLCVPKLSAGSSCNSDSQCISGVCENSVCGG